MIHPNVILIRCSSDGQNAILLSPMEAQSKNQEKTPSVTEMKRKIAASLESIRRLKELCNSGLSDSKTQSPEEMKKVLEECSRLKGDIEKSSEFCSTAAKKTAAVNKLLEIERKRRWRLKKRRLDRVRNTFYRSMVAERNQCESFACYEM
mgnify:FL=1